MDNLFIVFIFVSFAGCSLILDDYQFVQDSADAGTDAGIKSNGERNTDASSDTGGVTDVGMSNDARTDVVVVAASDAGFDAKIDAHTDTDSAIGDGAEAGIDALADMDAEAGAKCEPGWSGDDCDNCLDDEVCDDGEFCNGKELCDSDQKCVKGLFPCDDDIDCTLDGCNEKDDACSHDPDDSVCENGIWCSGIRLCDRKKGCQDGPSPCDDGIDCTVDDCQETPRACSYICECPACAVSTNQSNCYDMSKAISCFGSIGTAECATSTEFCGQDAQYQTEPHVFLNKTVQGDQIVEDTQTGLVWERNHLANRSYLNAQAYCNDLSFAEIDDWRLPTYHESLNIVDYSGVDVVFDPDVFSTPDDGEFVFWTDSVVPSDQSQRFTLNLNTGIIGTDSAYDSDRTQSLRCVAGPIAAPDDQRFSVFESNGDELVRDQFTGLIWTKSHSEYVDWMEALIYCESSDAGGYEDWRLPNVNELRSLIDVERHSPYTFFPDMEPDEMNWSSTTQASSPGYDWIVMFGSANFSNNSHWGTNKGSIYDTYARCVRGGR